MRGPEGMVVTEQRGGLAACCYTVQTGEANAGEIGKGFSSGAAQPGRMVGSGLRAHFRC